MRVTVHALMIVLLHLRFFQRDDEINALNKKIQQVENDLDTTTENLSTANTNLESANKQVQEVSYKTLWARIETRPYTRLLLSRTVGQGQ